MHQHDTILIYHYWSSICPSIHLSNAGSVPKWLKESSNFFTVRYIRYSSFWAQPAVQHHKIPRDIPSAGALNTRVGKKIVFIVWNERCLSQKQHEIGLYLRWTTNRMSYVASQSMLIPMTWSILKGGMWGPISSSGSSSVRSYHVTYKDQIRHGKYVLQRGVFRAVSKTHLKGMGPQFPNFWRLPHDVHTIWPRMIKFCTEIRVEKRFQGSGQVRSGPHCSKIFVGPLIYTHIIWSKTTKLGMVSWGQVKGGFRGQGWPCPQRWGKHCAT